MPTPQQIEIHHSQNARFQSGNRLYRIVILGQGGVGKSGELQCALQLRKMHSNSFMSCSLGNLRLCMCMVEHRLRFKNNGALIPGF